jgi:hypothetical protein
MRAAQQDRPEMATGKPNGSGDRAREVNAVFEMTSIQPQGMPQLGIAKFERADDPCATKANRPNMAWPHRNRPAQQTGQHGGPNLAVGRPGPTITRIVCLRDTNPEVHGLPNGECVPHPLLSIRKVFAPRHEGNNGDQHGNTPLSIRVNGFADHNRVELAISAGN